MRSAMGGVLALCTLAAPLHAAQQTARKPAKPAPPAAKSSDASPHQVFFIPVDQGVKLEVLDWGGVGRPLVLLPGIGYDAHVYDTFAPKLTEHHHVYGITRRGFGASSAPAPSGDNYSADRLGDDVLAVIRAMHIDRPVLIGHAKAGQELSSIGSRHPEMVSGLVYLDAAYSYAFYDSKHGDLLLDAIDLRKQLDTYLTGNALDLNQYLADLKAALPKFKHDVDDFQEELALTPAFARGTTAPPPILVAIEAGARKYTHIDCPALAIYADPHNFGRLYADDPSAHQALILDDFARTSAQADAFQAGVPGSRVVRIPNASHMIFSSNEAEVLREINAFVDKLQ